MGVTVQVAALLAAVGRLAGPGSRAGALAAAAAATGVLPAVVAAVVAAWQKSAKRPAAGSRSAKAVLVWLSCLTLFLQRSSCADSRSGSGDHLEAMVRAVSLFVCLFVLRVSRGLQSGGAAVEPAAGRSGGGRVRGAGGAAGPPHFQPNCGQQRLLHLWLRTAAQDGALASARLYVRPAAGSLSQTGAGVCCFVVCC